MTSSLVNPFRFGSQTSVLLVHTESSTAVDNDTWTVNNVAYGDAPDVGQSRHLILVVTYSDNDVQDASHTIGVTLGGNAVTEANSRVTSSASNNSTSGVWIGTVEMAAGTSGQLVFTITGFSGTMDAYGVAVYRAINLASATPTSTPTGTSAVTLSVPSNGFGVAGATELSSNALGAFTGSNAITAYSGTRAGAAMSRTVAGTVTHDSSNGVNFAGATWEFI